jgi:mutator family transposase
LARDLAMLDIKVLMVDGEHLAEHLVVVALAITADGTKVPVGLWEGSTENATVVKALLADLVARGLDASDGLPVVIDGAKAPSAAVRAVFGAHAAIQRCTVHCAEQRIMPSWVREPLWGKGSRLVKSAYSLCLIDPSLQRQPDVESRRRWVDRHGSGWPDRWRRTRLGSDRSWPGRGTRRTRRAISYS